MKPEIKQTDSYSKKYYHRRKAGLNNPDKTDYTPAVRREDIIDRYNITEKDGEFYQGSRKLVEVAQQNNQVKYSNHTKYYLYYNLKNGAKYKMIAVHRLKWLYYNGDIPKGYIVDHINNDSTDNRLENLQLITRSENTKKNAVGRNQLYYQLGAEEYERRQQIRKTHQQAVELKKQKAAEQRAQVLKDHINRLVKQLNQLATQYNRRKDVIDFGGKCAERPQYAILTEQLKKKIEYKAEKLEQLYAQYEAQLSVLNKEDNKDDV